MTKVVDRDAMRIRLDFNNMMAEYIGKEGIEPSEINGMAAQLKEAADGMAEGVGAHEMAACSPTIRPT